MRILHIGDLHFKPNKNNYDQNLMIDKMVEGLKGKDKIDFIFFTGDLVNAGLNPPDFESAYEFIFKRIAEELGVPANNMIISQGNHDVNRSQSSLAVINYFAEKVCDNDKLNEEYLKPSIDLTTSLKPSENFVAFATAKFNSADDIRNSFYSTHIREYEEGAIGIICINSAWLSTGLRPDLNNLMFPVVALKEALTKIGDVSKKVLLIHHPLGYFKEFNASELEDIIHREFDLLFSGHLHKEQIATKYAGNNGIFTNTTQATLTFDKGGEIGFSIIEITSDDSEITIERSTFISKENKFVNLSPVVVQVPCGIEKSNQNKLRKKITSKIRVELESADELMLDNSEEARVRFLDTFTPPVISSKSDTESTSPTSATSLINYGDVSKDNSNYLLFGKDKCGKTSLLKKFQLYYLKNYSLLGKVPFYLDYKELEAKTSPVDLSKLIRSYYEISSADTEKIINSGNLVLLADNLNTASPVNTFIIEFLEQNKQVKFIITSDYLASRIYFEELDHLEYHKLYFKDLSRNEIRLYTEKKPEIKSSDREDVLERITKTCQQLQLPINYWTISLILLIYKKSNDDYNKNLFGILDLCVDEILQKKQLTLTRSKLTFEQYKEICSQVAHYLLIKFREEVYSTTYSNLLQYLDLVISKNPRLVADPREILDYLLSCGILKDKNGKITFRLNGLFEYFLAFYIYHHDEFKKELLSNDGIYLSFKNELEIYTGFNRQDEDFLREVFSKTKNVFDKIIKSYREHGTLDQVLMMKIGEANEFAEKVKHLKELRPLDGQVKDKILDGIDPLGTESEVHLKEIIDAEHITHEVLEKYLGILGRVFRNSDNIGNLDLVYEIFDYLVEAYCTFGFFLIDWVSNKSKVDNLNSDDSSDLVIGERILKIITTFIPVLAQVTLYDTIGHNSIKKIVQNKIVEYKKEHKNNQYKLFMLYFLLMDIDLKENKDLIEKVFEDVTLSPLKVATFFKTSFYFSFKAYKNKFLEDYFKTKVQEAKIRLDEKSGNINRSLSKKQKGNIARRAMNK